VLSFKPDMVIDKHRHQREAAIAFIAMTDHLMNRHPADAEAALSLIAQLQGFLVMTYYDDPPNCAPALRPMLEEMQRSVLSTFNLRIADLLSQPAQGEAPAQPPEPEPTPEAELTTEPAGP
jgi:hypothetical protein